MCIYHECLKGHNSPVVDVYFTVWNNIRVISQCAFIFNRLEHECQNLKERLASLENDCTVSPPINVATSYILLAKPGGGEASWESALPTLSGACQMSCYDIMQSCWRKDPDECSSFETLHHHLEEFLTAEDTVNQKSHHTDIVHVCVHYCTDGNRNIPNQ